MTEYLLDTNIISDLARNPAGPVTEHIRRIGEAVLCTSIIVAAELRYGCARKESAALTARVEAVLAELRVLPFDHSADIAYGRVRADLEARGAVIGGNDLLIAAHALALGATVITANAGEFGRIDGLAVENWLQGAR